MDLAGFVRAMLAPHYAEDSKLGDVGVAAQNLSDASVFLRRQAVFSGDFWRNFDFGGGHGPYGLFRAPVRNSPKEKEWAGPEITPAPLPRQPELRSSTGKSRGHPRSSVPIRPPPPGAASSRPNYVRGCKCRRCYSSSRWDFRSRHPNRPASCSG